MDRNFSDIEPVEHGLMASLLRDTEGVKFFEVYDKIKSSDFYNQTNNKIFSMIEELVIKQSSKIDIAVLLSFAKDDETKKHIKALFGADKYAISDISGAAERILDASRIRRLLNVSDEIRSDVIETNDIGMNLIAKYERKLYDISQHKTDTFHMPAEWIDTFVEEFKEGQGEKITGVPSCFEPLDRMTFGFMKGSYNIIAARPSMGKTMMLLQILIDNCIRGNTSGLFSIEMSKDQIKPRIVSFISEIPMHKIISRNLIKREIDWLKGKKKIIKELPLLIDNTSGLTIPELFSRARRMKMRHPEMNLLGIDYMQLMRDRTGGSTNDDMTYISQSIKELARTLDMPIIVLSQLSRECEKRESHRPILSDLRSCVPAGTLVGLSNGQFIAIEELISKSNFEILSLDNQGKISIDHCEKIWPVGKKQATKITLTSGREIICSTEHKFKRFDSWIIASDLKIGDQIATTRILPEPKDVIEIPDYKIIMLGHLIGDGSYLKRSPIRYTTSDKEKIDLLMKIGQENFNCKVKLFPYNTWTQMTFTGSNRWHLNSLRQWIVDLGIFNNRSYEKHIPKCFYSLSNRSLALFLHHLFSTDGTVHENGITYSTNSKQLVIEISNLLLRFGITARLRSIKQKKNYRTCFCLDITGVDNYKKFASKIGIFGKKGKKLELISKRKINSNTNVDVFPVEFNKILREAIVRTNNTNNSFLEMMLKKETTSRSLGQFRKSKKYVKKAAIVLNDPVITKLANDDIFWDEIKNIEKLDEIEMFDLTASMNHNWISNGIISHNSGSLEQDSDLIIFLYRDAYYTKKYEDKTIELIIAKQRNGPIGTIYAEINTETQKIIEK